MGSSGVREEDNRGYYKYRTREGMTRMMTTVRDGVGGGEVSSDDVGDVGGEGWMGREVQESAREAVL